MEAAQHELRRHLAAYAAHIAKALDLYERVQAGDAGLVEAIEQALVAQPLVALGNGQYRDPDYYDCAKAALAALVGEG